MSLEPLNHMSIMTNNTNLKIYDKLINHEMEKEVDELLENINKKEIQRGSTMELSSLSSNGGVKKKKTKEEKVEQTVQEHSKFVRRIN